MASCKSIVLLLFVIYSCCDCLIKISNPSSLDKDYEEANLNLYPKQFDVTAALVVADPYEGCSTYKNSEQIEGKIVILDGGGTCSVQQKTKLISQAGGVGAILLSGKGNLGIYYNYATKPDPDVLLPAINAATVDFQDVIDYVKNHPEINVTATIQDTTANPFLEWAHSGAGIVFQIYFEILAFATFVIGCYKLYHYIQYAGFRFHAQSIILTCEIAGAVLRMVMMSRPLSFYSFGFNIVADAFLLGYSNDLSFTTDLLITFYWQEILTKCDKKLSNKVLNNLSKFRIPFAIATLIIWVLDTVANLSRGLVLHSFENASLFSAIIYVIFSFVIAVFFLFTGIKVLRVTGLSSTNSKIQRVSKMMRIIVVTGALLILQILAIILYISPVQNINPKVTLFIFWLWWNGLFGVSLTKVFMIETKSKKDSAELKVAEKHLSSDPEPEMTSGDTDSASRLDLKSISDNKEIQV